MQGSTCISALIPPQDRWPYRGGEQMFRDLPEMLSFTQASWLGEVAALGPILAQYKLAQLYEDISLSGSVWQTPPYLAIYPWLLDFRQWKRSWWQGTLPCNCWKTTWWRHMTGWRWWQTKEQFEEGDLVYLRLQPYRQVSVGGCRHQKLSPLY